MGEKTKKREKARRGYPPFTLRHGGVPSGKALIVCEQSLQLSLPFLITKHVIIDKNMHWYTAYHFMIRKLPCHQLLLNMIAPVPTCRVLFLSMQGSVP